MSEKNNEVSKIIEAVKNDGGEFVTSDKFEKSVQKMIHVPPQKASNYKGFLQETGKQVPLYTGDLFEATIEKEIENSVCAIFTHTALILTISKMEITATDGRIFK